MNERVIPKHELLANKFGFQVTERVYIRGISNEVYEVCNFDDSLVVIWRILPGTIDNAPEKENILIKSCEFLQMN